MELDLYLKDPQFPEDVAATVYRSYEQLSKKGKPQKLKEWTLLSAIIMRSSKWSQSENGCSNLKTVALGTGSKCIGKSKMSCKGDIINDSHAEILARRAFLRFLYDELGKVTSGQPSEVFKPPDPEDENHCCLQPGISFHFFTSHTPCGDASIIPKDTPSNNTVINITHEIGQTLHSQTRMDSSVAKYPREATKINTNKAIVKHDTSFSEHLNSQHCLDEMIPQNINFELERLNGQVKRKCDIDDDIIGKTVIKRLKKSFEDIVPAFKDIHRTGAKCVAGGDQDPQTSPSNYHTLGVLRTKPGRGERTESLACSDKMALWNVVGCQGALISLFLAQPIYLTSVTVGRCPFSLEAMQRALYQRLHSHELTLPPGYCIHQPVLLHAPKLEFEASKAMVEREAGGSIVPCPAAITWFASQNSDGYNHDVIVQGKRQGFIKKDLDKPKAWSQVCCWSLFRQFYRVLQSAKQSLLPSKLREVVQPNITRLNLQYSNAKYLATRYQQAKTTLKLHTVFSTWPRKSRSFLNFTADS